MIAEAKATAKVLADFLGLVEERSNKTGNYMLVNGETRNLFSLYQDPVKIKAYFHLLQIVAKGELSPFYVARSKESGNLIITRAHEALALLGIEPDKIELLPEYEEFVTLCENRAEQVRSGKEERKAASAQAAPAWESKKRAYQF